MIKNTFFKNHFCYLYLYSNVCSLFYAILLFSWNLENNIRARHIELNANKLDWTKQHEILFKDQQVVISRIISSAMFLIIRETVK